MALSPNEKRRFFFTVEGKYYGAHKGTGMPIVKQYIAKFVLPSQEAALSTIVKHLLTPYLTMHYEDFGSVRTHQITSCEVNGRLPDPKVLQMSFEDMEIQDLADFCIIKQIFVDPFKHKDFEACKKYVQELYQSRVDEKNLAKKTGKDREQKEIVELLKLNDLPFIDPSIPNVNMQRAGAAIKGHGDGRLEQRVGSDAISVRPAPAEDPLPVGAPLLEEVPVDNDPKLTAQAFEEAAKQREVQDIFS